IAARVLIETAHGHVFDHACPQWADGTLGGIGGHQGFLSRAEGCWTFDARDRTPRSSRATAHHLVENAPTQTRAPSRASGFVLRCNADIAMIANGHFRSLAAISTFPPREATRLPGPGRQISMPRTG